MDSPITARPPTLDISGSNYPLWKSRMRMYIKSLDERAWLAVLDGWRPPRIPEENPRDPQIPEERLKPERDWTTEERVESNFNSKASFETVWLTRNIFLCWTMSGMKAMKSGTILSLP